MIILSIETSCDETAVSIIEAKGSKSDPSFKILGNALYSQAKLHEKYGGVFPNLAKREHAKNLIPLFKKVLEEAGFLSAQKKAKKNDTKKIKEILEREPELFKNFVNFIPKIEKPPIDLVAVTYGPGLEPALWVGINFAKSLAHFWNIPVVPVNHMEGHILSVLAGKTKKETLKFPILGLLISGGHTQLVYAKKPFKYKIVGDTKDDAVGEAYDKVARMLGLPYPGGPQIAKLAKESRNKKEKTKFVLPRPMIHSGDLNFSFSGLKTSVLYSLQKEKKLTSLIKRQISGAFEDAVLEVLSAKTQKALEKYETKTLVVAGGVIANEEIRRVMKSLQKKNRPLKVVFPETELSTDNSIMIAVAGFLRKEKAVRGARTLALRAQGNAKVI